MSALRHYRFEGIVIARTKESNICCRIETIDGVELDTCISKSNDGPYSLIFLLADVIVIVAVTVAVAVAVPLGMSGSVRNLCDIYIRIWSSARNILGKILSF